jgi:hypothetical protein
MADAERKTKRSEPAGSAPHVVVRSIAFTPAALEVLEALASGIASKTGRKTSVSAVVRAVLRHVDEQPDLTTTLANLVEHEQSHEVVWGKPPRPR